MAIQPSPQTHRDLRRASFAAALKSGEPGRGRRAGWNLWAGAALACSIAWFSPAASGQVLGDKLQGLVHELSAEDSVQSQAALAQLSGAGIPAAKAALLEFEVASARARTLRARVVRLQGDSSLLGDVLARCGDSSPAVRAEFAVYLGRALRDHPAPVAALMSRTIGLLAEMAASDVEASVRTKALESLSRSDSEAAARALAELTRTLAGKEAALAARALSNSACGGALILELVQSSFDDPTRRLSELALTVLLAEGYGQSLAEAEGGGLDPRSRRPLSVAGRDASLSVRAAADLAFPAFLSRAQFLAATARAETVGAALAGEVADPARVLLATAMFTLTSGADPTHALAALDRLTALYKNVEPADARGRFDLAVAHTLSAAAQLASGKSEPATSRLEAARTLLAGLASESIESAGDDGAELAAQVAAERAVVESYALLALLRSGEAPDSPACRRIARALHELSLREQLLGTVGVLNNWAGSLDSIVHHPHGPFELLLSNPELEHGLAIHPLDLKLALGRALAAVVPDELPGFSASDKVEPLDAQRIGLLGQIEYSRIKQVQLTLEHLPADSTERSELENALRVLSAELSPEADLHRVRLPSALAIELAGSLREEGRSQEASVLATNAKESLLRADFLFGGPGIQELIASAESILGSCATDEGDPQKADKLLNAALDRLQTVASSGNDDVHAKSLRSGVLVSLAVNANVKLRDPTKALAYFERAFELRQDDLTRTLLACYRARAGRGEEARAILRETPESPYNYYNLACTYALLGDKELAFNYLARELSFGRNSAGAIARQRVWARSDPDLASLHDDPRFLALLGK